MLDPVPKGAVNAIEDGAGVEGKEGVAELLLPKLKVEGVVPKLGVVPKVEVVGVDPKGVVVVVDPKGVVANVDPKGVVVGVDPKGVVVGVDPKGVVVGVDPKGVAPKDGVEDDVDPKPPVCGNEKVVEEGVVELKLVEVGAEDPKLIAEFPKDVPKELGGVFSSIEFAALLELLDPKIKSPPVEAVGVLPNVEAAGVLPNVKVAPGVEEPF